MSKSAKVVLAFLHGRAPANFFGSEVRLMQLRSILKKWCRAINLYPG